MLTIARNIQRLKINAFNASWDKSQQIMAKRAQIVLGHRMDQMGWNALKYLIAKMEQQDKALHHAHGVNKDIELKQKCVRFVQGHHLALMELFAHQY